MNSLANWLVLGVITPDLERFGVVSTGLLCTVIAVKTRPAKLVVTAVAV